MEFTLVEEIGGGVFLGFVVAWIADWFCFFMDLATGCVRREPRKPLTGGSVEGIEGLEVG